ncbi:MAG: prepilin peptidase [Marmoricola sp.]
MSIAAVLVTALVAAGLAMLGPAVIARIPEPAPPGLEHERDQAVPPEVPPEEPKEPYAAIAALPRLGIGMAVVAAVVGALVGWSVGWTGVVPLWCYVVPLGVVLAVVDWRTRLLPTRLIAPSYGVVVVLALVAAWLDGSRHELFRAGYGWLVWGGVFVLLWLVYPRGMGYGDVRLSGLLGIATGVLGWAEMLVGLYAAFLLGGVIGFALSRLGVVERKNYPFGPFMVLGAVIGVLVGAPIAQGLGY